MRKDIFRILSLSLLTAGIVAAQAQIKPTTTAPGAPASAGQGTLAPAPAAPAGPSLGEPAPAKPLPEAPLAKPKSKKLAKPTCRGKLTALDKIALTLTVTVKEKARTFQITPDTRFIKGGKPATMGDGVLNEEVTVVARPAVKGKLQAAESVSYSGKAASTKPPQKTKKAASGKTETKDAPK